METLSPNDVYVCSLFPMVLKVSGYSVFHKTISIFISKGPGAQKSKRIPNPKIVFKVENRKTISFSKGMDSKVQKLFPKNNFSRTIFFSKRLDSKVQKLFSKTISQNYFFFKRVGFQSPRIVSPKIVFGKSPGKLLCSICFIFIFIFVFIYVFRVMAT